ncbi:hypothetical protein AB0D09_31440 [Streptomyces sp. NPDC049097]|uniref:hypothetical protein n=1 Tax=Streptomyces sp. NPDC049097 TaxID=3155497 RepID=UPI003423FCEB
MSIKLRRALLAALAFVAAYTGGWAYFAPENWYANFPGFGRSWLPQLGPYNMHLAMDDGAMFLAMAVLSLFAIRYAHNMLVVQITACTWLVFNVLHLTFHMRHLSVYNTMDKILNVVALGLLVLITVALFAGQPEGEVMRAEPREPSVDSTSGDR